MNIDKINKIYEYARRKLSYEEVSALSAMMYSLTKKHEERRKVIDLNREIETLNKKCSWKTDYKPVELLQIPEL